MQRSGSTERSIRVSATTIDRGGTKAVDRYRGVFDPKQIEPAYQTDLARAFAYDDRRREKRLGEKTDRALNVVLGPHDSRFVHGSDPTNHEELVAREFPYRNRRMSCYKGLQWGLSLLCTKCPEKANNSVRFEPVFEFINKDDGRLLRCFALKTRYEEPRGAEP